MSNLTPDQQAQVNALQKIAFQYNGPEGYYVDNDSNIKPYSGGVNSTNYAGKNIVKFDVPTQASVPAQAYSSIATQEELKAKYGDYWTSRGMAQNPGYVNLLGTQTQASGLPLSGSKATDLYEVSEAYKQALKNNPPSQDNGRYQYSGSIKMGITAGDTTQQPYKTLPNGNYLAGSPVASVPAQASVSPIGQLKPTNQANSQTLDAIKSTDIIASIKSASGLPIGQPKPTQTSGSNLIPTYATMKDVMNKTPTGYVDRDVALSQLTSRTIQLLPQLNSAYANLKAAGMNINPPTDIKTQADVLGYAKYANTAVDAYNGAVSKQYTETQNKPQVDVSNYKVYDNVRTIFNKSPRSTSNVDTIKNEFIPSNGNNKLFRTEKLQDIFNHLKQTGMNITPPPTNPTPNDSKVYAQYANDAINAYNENVKRRL